MSLYPINKANATWSFLLGCLLCLMAFACGGKKPNNSEDGSKWVAVNTGLESLFIEFLAINPLNSNVILAGAFEGLYKSSNGGQTWTRVDSGWSYVEVTAIAFNVLDPQVIYSGTKGAGIFKSEDGGENWEARNVGLENLVIYSIAVNPNHPDTLYVGTDEGIYRSYDAADTLSRTHWYDRTFVAIDPQNPQNIYAGGQYNNFHKSQNGGDTWATSSGGIQLGGPATRIQWVLINPNIPSNLYAASSNSGIYKSTSAASEWAPANSGLGGVGDVRAMALDSTNPDILHAATANGVYRSTDAAETWQKMSEGLTNLDVRAMAHGSTSSFYVGTWGGGVFKWQSQ